MNDFSAVTWNVLAQCYVRADRYPSSPPKALDPAHRLPLIARRVEALDADLLCLQEVEPEVYDALRARLDATHASAHAVRRGRSEGSAVFARRAAFTWERDEVLHFEAHRPGDDDLALIVRLRRGDAALAVAATHLTWQPDSTPPEQHLGRRQLLELLAQRDGAATWLFAGDFNATSQSAVLRAAYEAGLEESCRAQRPWDTCAINGRPRKIDYLLFSAGRLAPRPGVLPQLTRATALPSLEEPSDHLPLRVEFATSTGAP